ncbi:fructose-bisphosphate aldolase, cytoplasmic isozyme 1-like [Mercurialis annua]|uniref:fructose-bisphosphate aldolase, cytoplasmic isozyme 1-like n=1 Tax=Mercurialis annua TaxID=3986 RepID=UPI00215FFC4C|nr:fructose-bisphosphate aldolase, cytoplasmic isozyme 1-like [Mercurialis annua]
MVVLRERTMRRREWRKKEEDNDIDYYTPFYDLPAPLYQKTSEGKPFVELLQENGVVPDIKVDKGTVKLAGTDGETTTEGFDSLATRCQQYYKADARFFKYRSVLKIGPTEPSELAIQQ